VFRRQRTGVDKRSFPMFHVPIGVGDHEPQQAFLVRRKAAKDALDRTFGRHKGDDEI